MFEVKDLSVGSDKQILNGISFSVSKGERVLLLGRNGSGKTTLSRAIAGDPSLSVSGDILLNGESIINLKPHERFLKGIFVAFQFPPPIEGVSVEKFLGYVYKKIYNSTDGFYNTVERMMEKLSLNKSILKRSLDESLSGGERKKLEVLQLMMVKPKVAVLDEVDSGLDIDSIINVGKIINEMKDTSFIIITHAGRIADEIDVSRSMLMCKGRIVEVGSGRTLLDEVISNGYGRIVEKYGCKQ